MGLLESLMLTGLAMPVGSYHFERHGQNEFNPGVVAEFTRRDAPQWGALVGVYHNSLRRTTAFASAYRSLGALGPVNFGASLGLGTGYSVPVVGGLHATVAGRVSFTFVPPIPGHGGGVVAFALRIPVGQR